MSTEKVVKAFETLETWVKALPHTEEKDCVVEALSDVWAAWKEYRLKEIGEPIE